VSSTDLPANGTFPGQATLFNYDTDRDSQAGLVLQTGGSGAAESDTTKYQNWQTGVLDDGLEISGTVTLRLSAAMSGFSATTSGEVVAYLRECNGVSYSEIASSSVAASPWDSDTTGGFVQRTIEFEQVSHTIAAGNELEVKLIIGSSADSAMWLAYDTASYPALVEFPELIDLHPHHVTRSIAASSYYELQTAGRDGGYYLHDSPSPPTGDAHTRADLPATHVYPSATALVNYDNDLDAIEGRSLAVGGSGVGESDLPQYQNWRTEAFTESQVINGKVQVQLWSAMSGFDTGTAGEIVYYLRDYNGSGYTEIASSTLAATPWDLTGGGRGSRR
jgi:hypothetical protein